ncbi:MAG TPA: hypothetical protein VHY58_17375 [Streptosporangiaceae bacterium]|jgi:hypothetical protein|nr:hypothetical protein [Streptosporangiaceae bacterium]
MATMMAPAEPAAGPGPGPVPLPGLVWVVWRQHRAALAGLFLLVGLAAIVMIDTGLPIHTTYASFISDHCATSRALNACGNLSDQVAGDKEGGVPIALHVFPVLIGIFLGAPLLAREIEAGTFRFAWTQEVGRTRWLLAKLAMLGLAVIAACVVLGLLATWWLHPFDVAGVSSRWQGGEFDVAPATLAGWGLLAFAGGVLAGVLIKRTVPAMAATAVAVTAVLGLFWFKLGYLVLSIAPRTGLGNPLSLPNGLIGPGSHAINAWYFGPASGADNRWLVRGWYTQAGGAPMTGRTYGQVTNALLGGDTDKPRPSPVRWLAEHHDAFHIAYQPGGRFWEFQAVTAAGLVLLALALAATAIALVRRRGA